MISIRHFLCAKRIYILMIYVTIENAAKYSVRMDSIMNGREGEAMYQKEVIYMGLYKEENRMGSAGFLKVENRERESRLYMKIQNVPLGISGRFPIRIYNGNVWKEINGVTVQDGKGNWEERFAENVDQTMVQIMLPGGYMLKGKSRYALEQASQRSASEHENMVIQRDTDEQIDAGRHRNATEQENMVRRQNVAEQSSIGVERGADSQVDAGTRKTTAEPQNAYVQQNVDEQNPEIVQKSAHIQNRMEQQSQIAAQEERQQSSERQSQTDMQEEGQSNMEYRNQMTGLGDEQTNTVTQKCEEIRSAVSIPARGDVSSSGKTERNLESSRKNPQTIIITEELPRRNPENCEPMEQSAPGYHLKEDKWEQLLDTYEQIHPYGDDRVYIKIEPRDFVILQSNYQHLVNNSFLLHGFYNYRYIILGKEQDCYYLGVPGVFYEREKMVALMFGFEAFECPGGNVGAGEFGYYLRKVEL